MSLKLSALEPEFVRYVTREETIETPTGPVQVLREAIHTLSYGQKLSIDQAQGVWFLCPLCYTKKGGPIGVHMCEVTFRDRDVRDGQGVHNAAGQPVRWKMTGSGVHNLTVDPSVQLQGGCNWHGFIKDGLVTII